VDVWRWSDQHGHGGLSALARHALARGKLECGMGQGAWSGQRPILGTVRTAAASMAQQLTLACVQRCLPKNWVQRHGHN
jgi:hypothetical protein